MALFKKMGPNNLIPMLFSFDEMDHLIKLVYDIYWGDHVSIKKPGILVGHPWKCMHPEKWYHNDFEQLSQNTYIFIYVFLYVSNNLSKKMRPLKQWAQFSNAYNLGKRCRGMVMCEK